MLIILSWLWIILNLFKPFWLSPKPLKIPLNPLETLKMGMVDLNLWPKKYMEPLLFNLSYPVISWNIHKTPMKHGLKYVWKYLKHPWKRHKMPLKYLSNSHIKIFKIPWDTLEIPLNEIWENILYLLTLNDNIQQ